MNIASALQERIHHARISQSLVRALAAALARGRPRKLLSEVAGTAGKDPMPRLRLSSLNERE